MSKKKNVIAHVGNFEITKDGGIDHDYIRIKAINGHWGITYRDDSPMYGVWMAMCKDPEYVKGMEVIITMTYTLTNMLFDKEFVDDFFSAIKRKNERDIAAKPEPTEQEQEDAIAEVEMMEEIKKDLTE